MVCFIHRWIVSINIDSNRPLCGWTKHHLSHCSECRQFRDGLQKMDAFLKDSKETAGVPAPPRLHTRIMGGVADTEKSRAGGFPKLAVSGAAVLLVISASLFVIDSSRPQNREVQTVDKEVLRLHTFLEGNGNAGTVVAQIPSKATQSMERELVYLQGDIGRAVRFCQQFASRDMVAKGEIRAKD